MPIKGISEIRRLPRVGKVRLGIKAKSAKGTEYPKATDYFVVNTDDSTPQAAAVAFHAVYGDQPRELDIMFPVEDLETIFPQYYRRYGKGTGLICKGDGQNATEIDRETGEMIEHECLGADCERQQDKQCHAVGNLLFLLPHIDGLGCWQLDTGSWNSIVNINSALQFVRGIAGRVAMIPLKLRIKPKDAQVNGAKKRIYVLDLIPPATKLDDLLKATLPRREIAPASPERLAESRRIFYDEEPAAPAPVSVSPDAPKQAEATPPPPAEVPKAETSKSQKVGPRTAPEVKAAITKAVNTYRAQMGADAEGAASNGRRGASVGMLNKACEDDAAKRHSVTMYLYGKAHIAELSNAEAQATIDWLKQPGDNNWALRPNALSEAAACVVTWNVAQGQQELTTEEAEQ